MEKKPIPVIVTLSSYARAENGEKEQPIRLMCHGKMRLTADGCMLRYQEVQQEDPKAAPNVQDVMLTVQTGSVPRVTMNRMAITALPWSSSRTAASRALIIPPTAICPWRCTPCRCSAR